MLIMRKKRIQLTDQKYEPAQMASIPFKKSIRWWSQDELNIETTPSISIFMTQKAMLNAHVISNSDLSHEVGGWLIGKIRKDRQTNKKFIIIENVLPAKHTRQGSAYLTFTQSSQVSLLNNLENYFPGKHLLGWFHTHPHMGVFFSSMDAWLHENFFRDQWQVALVIEPVSSQAGFFIQDQFGVLERNYYYGFYELLNQNRESCMVWKNLVNKVDQLYSVSPLGSDKEV